MAALARAAREIADAGAIAQIKPLAVDAQHEGVRRAFLFAFVAVGVAVALLGEITGRGQGILGG